MAPPAKSSRARSLRQVVLCIDDNELLLECYKEFLRAFGFEVLSASRGREGLELARLSRVDVVVLDYRMPEMDGLQVVTELRRIRPGTPIILHSGMASVPARMLELVDSFVPKANVAGGLLAAIAELIGTPKLPPRAKAVSEKTSAGPAASAA